MGAMAEDLTRANLASSLVTLGQGAINAALLINGASAVAILAFVGQVFNELPTGVFASAKYEIAIFALGVFVAAFSTLLAYLAQFYYYRATGKGFDETVETKIAEVIRHGAIVLVFLSFVIFIVGICLSLQMFSNYAISG